MCLHYKSFTDIVEETMMKKIKKSLNYKKFLLPLGIVIL